ncbi:MAG: metal ABC transporter solute-binding protein, Zn/Mn family, partial [Gammaproteobacteria bacterium]
AISKHIAEALITYDPKNTASYNKNLQRLLSRIEQTKSFIETTLDSNSISDRPPFIAYHDAFQYFEDENRLNYIDSISYDEETGPGLKHLRQIKSLIDEKNIQCLVYQAPKPAIVDSLTAQTSIKATALDPLGINVSNDKEAWFELMKQLATDFKQCLKR